MVQEEDLRTAMKQKDLSRRVDMLGEVWTGWHVSVVVGANEIVVVTELPRVERRFNRAAGGLQLAIEYVNSL